MPSSGERGWPPRGTCIFFTIFFKIDFYLACTHVLLACLTVHHLSGAHRSQKMVLCLLKLLMVESYYVIAGHQTQIFRKSGWCSNC